MNRLDAWVNSGTDRSDLAGTGFWACGRAVARHLHISPALAQDAAPDRPSCETDPQVYVSAATSQGPRTQVTEEGRTT